jgi:uncharacterized membrane protein YgdD (TMEM256/DUF423 family)
MHKFMRVDAQSEVPSADRWLGAMESGGEVRNLDFAIRYKSDPVTSSLFGLGGFVIWVLSIIAVANSNNDEVIGACGDGLRQIVLGHVVFGPCLIGVVCCAACCVGAVRTSPCIACVAGFGGVCVIVGLAVMAERAYTLSTNARASPVCVDVLKRYSAGINSDLLAIMGLVYFSTDVVVLAVCGIALVAVLVIGCGFTFCLR